MSRKKILRNYDNEGNLISLECNKCHKVKAVSEFNKHENKKDGVHTICKDCAKQYGKEYRNQNADKERERRKEYYKENADKERERSKQHYKENADKERERSAEYHNQKVEQSLKEIKTYVEIDPQKYNYNSNEQIYGVIYLVHNVKSDKYYIGQTTVGFDNRYQSGWLYEHSRKDTVKTDLELYGEDSFEYTKIFKVAHNQKDLDKLEAYYINYYNAYENGYNSNRGNIFTERTSYKINNIRFDWVA